MISIKKLLTIPSNYSHKFGEAGFLSNKPIFTCKNSKSKDSPKNRKEVRVVFRKLLLLNRKQKNIWYKYEYDKNTNIQSFIIP